jgi:superfamily II DNA or RNA helicase
MNLKDLIFKKSYESDSDDILNSFYIPALSVSVKYQRLAGFFSSTSLAVAAKGISSFICNNGKMQLICSAKLQKADVEAIVKAEKTIEKLVELSALQELRLIGQIEDQCFSDHVQALAWMVAHGFLEIKIAIVKDERNKPLDAFEVIQVGIFHQKVGILYDLDGNIISFSGSDNESASGWTKNIEEFKVFRGWEEVERQYLETDRRKFHKFWDGFANRVEVMDVPQAVKNKLIEMAPEDFEGLKLRLAHHNENKQKKEIKLWGHQLEAIQKWLVNEKKCIFEMATGTGKTLTALGCVKELFKLERNILVIIACPYNHLSMQWREEIKEFGLDVELIIADSSNSGWKDKLMDNIFDLNNRVKDELMVLTTHDTFYRKDFKDIITRSINKIFIIGDEVHGMWSDERKNGFLERYDYRLGLSATPSRWFDAEGTKELFAYFNIKSDEDIFKFPLEKAIKTINPLTGETYLTPYDYFPYFGSLSNDEMDRYIEETKKIIKSYFISKNNLDRFSYFKLLCIKRQEIIKNAQAKITIFKEILESISEIKHCLVYCSPEQISVVQELLNSKGILQHKFTQFEGTKCEKAFGGISEREDILDKFSNETYKVLVAMQCLDEGVDIPQAKVGIILASTGNPRQYIQRRGRILRRFPGKTKACIYDILIVPSLNKRMSAEMLELEKKIMNKELMRYYEFASSASNVLDCLELVRKIEEDFKR